MNDLIRIENGGVLYGLLLKSTYKSAGVNFITAPEHTQQVAYMCHKKGTEISPHHHNRVCRTIYETQETLFVKSGRLRCDFYDDERIHLKSCILQEGDLIILMAGGHGFEVLEDVVMIEIKQGPYAGDTDKTRFVPFVSKDSNQTN